MRSVFIQETKPGQFIAHEDTDGYGPDNPQVPVRARGGALAVKLDKPGDAHERVKLTIAGTSKRDRPATLTTPILSDGWTLSVYRSIL